MFKKNFLSLIGLAFAGKALLAAAAVTLPTCDSVKGSTFAGTTCPSSDEAKTFCIDSGKIYPVTNVDTFTCGAAISVAGLYVFKIPANTCVLIGSSAPADWGDACGNYYVHNTCASDKHESGTCGEVAFNPTGHYKYDGVEKVNLSSTSIDTFEERIALYNCDATKCVQTSGVIRDKDGKSYKVSISGGATDYTHETTCEGNTGKILSDGTNNKICLGDGIEIADSVASGDYVMENAKENVFGTYSDQTAEIPIVITAKAKIIAWNNLKNAVVLPTCSEVKKSAFASTDCTVTDSNPVLTRCIDNGKIYEVTNVSTFACKQNPLKDGLYLFKVPVDGYELITDASAPTGWATGGCTSYFSDNAGTAITGDCGTNAYVKDTFYKKVIGRENVAAVNLSTDNIASDLKRIVLYNCNSVKCVITVGFVSDSESSSGAGDAANYLVKKGLGAEAIGNFENAACDNAKIGMIKSGDKTLCLGGDTPVSVAAGAGKEYVMSNVANNAFGTGSLGANYKIVIKTDVKIFALDNLAEVKLVKASNYEVVTDIDKAHSSIAATDAAKGYDIYNCRNSVCQVTAGYIKSGTDIFAYLGTGLATDGVAATDKIFVGETTIPNAEACGAENIGQLITSGGICINENEAVTFAEGNYMILPTAPAAKGTPFEDKDYVIPILTGPNYIVKSTFYNSVNVVNKIKGTPTSDFSSAISGLSSTPSNYVLVDCVEGKCKQTKGYVVVGTDSIFAFAGDAGTGITAVNSNTKVAAYVFDNVDKSGCQNTDVGKISYYRGFLCMNGSGITLSSNNVEYIVLKGTAAAGTPFYDTTDIVPLKRGSRYIIRDHFYTGVNLVKSATGDLIDIESTTFANTEVDLTDNYVLVDCLNGNCIQTQGYVLDKEKAIAFVNTSNGEEAKGAPYKGGIAAKASCEAAKVGTIIVTAQDEITGICINESLDVTFDDDNKGYMILSSTAAADGTPFKLTTARNIPLKHGSKYIIIDKFDSVVLYKSTAQSIINNFGKETITILSNDRLYQCSDGECKETQGYIKDSSKTYAFVTATDGVEATVTPYIGDPLINNVDGCTVETVGKIVEDGGVCYDEQNKVLYENDNETKLILEEAAAATGTPFALTDVTGAVPVVHGDSYIIVDKYVKALLYNRMDGTVVTDVSTANEDLAANPSNYYIYDCQEGVCKQSQGYLVNGGKVIGFMGKEGGVDVTSTLVTSFNSESSCTSGNVGKLLSGKGAICSGAGKSISLGSEDKRILMNNGNMENGTPFDDEIYSIPIKTGVNYVIVDKFIANSVNLVKKNEGIVTPSTKFNDAEFVVELSSNVSNYVIVECVSIKCKQTTGYIKSGTNYYAFGSGSGGSPVSSSITVASCDTNSDSGKIKSNGEVCIEGIRSVAMSSTAAYGMILKSTAAAGTPFVDDNYNVFIKNDAKYVIKDGFKTAVVLVKIADGTVKENDFDAVASDLVDNFAGYILVDCVDGICKRTAGYIKGTHNATRKRDTAVTKLYAFFESTVTEKAESDIFVSAANGDTQCTDSIIGQLTTNKEVCIKESKTIAFGNVNDRYMVLTAKAAKDKPFKDTTNNIVLKRDAKYIIKDLFYNNEGDCTTLDTATMKLGKSKVCHQDVVAGDKYSCEDGICTVIDSDHEKVHFENGSYLLKGDKNVVWKCKDGKCVKGTDYTGMYVFQGQDPADTSYETQLDDRALIDLRRLNIPITLYNCVEGICDSTTGFVKYSNRPSIGSCNGSCAVSTFGKCDGISNEDSGNIMKNMDICTNDNKGESPGEIKAVVGVGVLYGSHLYQRTGVNVVGGVLKGVYQVEGKRIKCTTGDCNNNDNFAGYDLNNDESTKEEYPLILCENKEHCKNVHKSEIANGYYLSTASANNKYIVCENNGCEEKTDSITKTDCNSNKYELIHHSSLKFCYGTTEIDKPATDTAVQYYLVNDRFIPKSKFNYPNMVNDEDHGKYPFLSSSASMIKRNVLMKFTKYSLTVLTGEEVPIGYLKNSGGTGYIECRFNSEGNGRECAAAVVDTTNVCNNVGGLYKVAAAPDTNKHKLCLDTTESKKVFVDLETDGDDEGTDVDDKGEYVIPLGSGEGLFGIAGRADKNYYIVVDVDGLGNVTVVKEPKINMYKYTDHSTSSNIYKIYDKTVTDANRYVENHICHAEDIKAYEYKLVPWSVESGANPEIDYYTDNDSST